MASTLTRRPLSSAVLSEGLFETGEALAAPPLVGVAVVTSMEAYCTVAEARRRHGGGL
ncbi:hypothetical protein ABZ654_03875 [Streptomyces hygroscopicus]|uniref:hypothetical protein n=1 Tax=Streptomyces hygroscopicus TaxID=1912 RepID=UPI0033F7DB9C